MNIKDNIAMLEAILFASGEPVEIGRLSSASGIGEDMIKNLMKLLSDRYEESGSGLMVLRLENSYQLCTRPEFADYIRSATETRRNTPLSAAAMEVLAIIAYNQPVSRGFVENVRGVDSSGVISSLVDKELLCEAGRLDVPGRPIVYRTTDNFLRCFGLSSIENLPPIPGEDSQVSFHDIPKADDS